MYCEKLIEGRLSFQGMNPEVEKLLESEVNEKRMKEEKSREQEISDTQMANHYKSNGRGRKNRNNNRRREFFSDENKGGPKFKKAKFLKPSD